MKKQSPHISFLPYDAFGISAACVPAIYQEYGESVPAILHIPIACEDQNSVPGHYPGKRLVDFLLLRIVSLQKTMGGDDIARTNVKAKLMADQGMADAVVPLSDDCLGFQICVDCRIYQKAKEAQQPYGVPISNH